MPDVPGSSRAYHFVSRATLMGFRLRSNNIKERANEDRQCGSGIANAWVGFVER